MGVHMKTTSPMHKLLMFILLGSFLVGCGKGIQVNEMSEAEIAAAVQSIDTLELKATVSASQVAMVNAQSALAVIVDPVSGSFNWNIFLGGVDFSKVADETRLCLEAAFPDTNLVLRIFTAPKDIAKGLKCILDDVVIVAGIANTNLNFALETLNKALANTTAGSPEALAIQAMIQQILPLQASYKLALQTMAGHLTIVTTTLSQLPTLATSAIPVPVLSLLIGYSVGNFVQPVIFEIMSFQARIQAL